MDYISTQMQEQYIQRCFTLAQKATGSVFPNPKVGAVLVYENEILAEGYHKGPGQYHAERDCLNKLSDEQKIKAQQSTLYINLEPCNHFGKTPPCTEIILEYGIKKVVISNVDPDLRVAGTGIETLREKGVEVINGISELEGRWLNRRFFTNKEKNRPYIILKWAMSEDGFIGKEDVAKYPISNALSQQLNATWRSQEDAIMIGSRTACIDDPQLKLREVKGKNPLRIVMGEPKNMTSLKLFRDKDSTLFISEKLPFPEIRGNKRWMLTDSKNLSSILNKLYAKYAGSVIVEGGSRLLQSFIYTGLWDEARVFSSEKKLVTGVPAPLFDIPAVDTYPVGDNQLSIYTNPASGYSYYPIL